MNRMAPCERCGCPVLFHRPVQVEGATEERMVCEQCSKERGTEVVCASP